MACTMVTTGDGYTPTPAISHAILTTTAAARRGSPTASSSPRRTTRRKMAGFKYNPPTGGPADTDVTRWIQDRANDLLASGVERAAHPLRRRAAPDHARARLRRRYVADLASVIDMDAIRGAGLRIGVDPLGGASVAFWHPIAERYGLDIEVVNDQVDPTFGFMPLDWDGRIRMDCSSPHAMARLIALKDRFDLAFGNDPTPTATASSPARG